MSSWCLPRQQRVNQGLADKWTCGNYFRDNSNANEGPRYFLLRHLSPRYVLPLRCQVDLNFHRTSISWGARPLLFKPNGFKLHSFIFGFSGGIGGSTSIVVSYEGGSLNFSRLFSFRANSFPQTIFFLLLFPRMIFVDFFQNLEENKTGGTKTLLWLGVKSEQRIRKSNGSIPAWKNTRGKIEVDFTLYFPLFLRRGLFCWDSEKCWQGVENSHFLLANENHSPSGNHLALPHSLKM